jgi:hypothetical protein
VAHFLLAFFGTLYFSVYNSTIHKFKAKVADKILKHYTDYEDIRNLLYDNLFKHLKINGIKDAALTNSQGEVEFIMSNPKYKP